MVGSSCEGVGVWVALGPSGGWEGDRHLLGEVGVGEVGPSEGRGVGGH